MYRCESSSRVKGGAPPAQAPRTDSDSDSDSNSNGNSNSNSNSS